MKNLKKDNIVLIGMPGCGKSSIGVVLAKVLGYHFVDSDLLIQDREGRLLKDIIAEDGLERFKEIENEVNAGIEEKHAVIATGGSVIYGKEAMEHLKSIGIVVYLKLSYKNLKCRLGNLKNRGVAMEEGTTLLDLYKERVPLYEKYADITLDEKNEQIRESIQKLVEIIESYE